MSGTVALLIFGVPQRRWRQLFSNDYMHDPAASYLRTSGDGLWTDSIPWLARIVNGEGVSCF